MLLALTREVSPSISVCELTHVERQPIDVALARSQHHHYENSLRALGCQVISVPAAPDLPDAVFVEDCAVVLDELAIITRPGAASRRPEVPSIAASLAPYRQLVYIQPPGFLDGGDVLRLGKTLYIGFSDRSNREAIAQMQSILTPFGYTVQGVPITGCLHLKSAVTQISVETLLLNPQWVDYKLFSKMAYIEVDEQEPYGANGLLIDDQLIYPTSYPRTLDHLVAHAIQVIPVDVSELIKAEGAVTCCSLVFQAETPPNTTT